MPYPGQRPWRVICGLKISNSTRGHWIHAAIHGTTSFPVPKQRTGVLLGIQKRQQKPNGELYLEGIGRSKMMEEMALDSTTPRVMAIPREYTIDQPRAATSSHVLFHNSKGHYSIALYEVEQSGCLQPHSMESPVS